ncbi:MarR family transcriptional regulator [Actinoplanes sp. SE50]|uniref:MarR family winged helix-turn-helix transcriptional regulator n=1 Tax=unclassified Actinoplanes TaxID=2626549 RepID=UPI00023EC65E|nr:MULTISPECIES: helix-turn-helix domain-containing protein [unclassified Actinoplanes]AEV85318.1 transcriptional regulator, MarR family [Actinoplanes sp. SE50/110]ATO83713.1 MarR family transcriptional regulator [Actinoplanes sp. SE50]SLM01121.1 MarR family transcriptional regulator [Actinoplanes sp. SE50/110]
MVNFIDPTDRAVWRPLWDLQAALDADIARLYAAADLGGLKSTWVKELIKLHAGGPMTITELAAAVGRTHSAMSQKVSAMRAAGWVRTTAGADGRTKKVALTAKAAAVADRLAAEWRATEEAVAEIEAEIPYGMLRVVRDIEAALSRKSFRDRIAERLAGDPAWGLAGDPACGLAGDPAWG